MGTSSDQWALILGASSGFGEATARKLASDGLNIAGVHLDRKEDLAGVDTLVDELKQYGVEVEFFNKNAARENTRDLVLQELGERSGADPCIRVLMHSIAFGTLKPYVSSEDNTLEQKQMEMTLDVMAHSLVYWVQDAVERNLLGDGGRIVAMTSAGGHTAWPHYGAVSAAKASIEAHIRQLAVELGDRGITANAIQAGVTDTPSLRKIPGHEDLIEHGKRVNPSGRLTEPNDVANAIHLLSQPESQFVTGNVIRCDGGEDIAG
jgi:NAD(P)-dependent dehydrogenase (short-subunit alcohol dehydrogenase family)